MGNSPRQVLGSADNRVLFALYRLKYLTPAMLCRALYAYPGSLRYAEDHLKRLAEAGYLVRNWVSKHTEPTSVRPACPATPTQS